MDTTISKLQKAAAELHKENTIDFASPIPFYFQLQQKLEARIISGEWEPRQKLPSEQKLCGHFGGTRNPYWMSLLADIAGRRFTTINLKQEANCYAAAMCAGIGVGLNEVKGLFKVDEAYLPNPDVEAFYAKKYEIFLETYQGLRKSYDMLAELEKFAAN